MSHQYAGVAGPIGSEIVAWKDASKVRFWLHNPEKAFGHYYSVEIDFNLR